MISYNKLSFESNSTNTLSLYYSKKSIVLSFVLLSILVLLFKIGSEQPTYSLKHCQNTETLTPTRIAPPYFIAKSKCVEVIKENDPSVG